MSEPLTWEITYKDEATNDTGHVADSSESECRNEIFLLKHTLYRGPNELIWYSKSGSASLEIDNLTNTLYIVTFGDFTEEMKIVSSVWSEEKECMKVILQSYAYFYLQYPVFINITKNTAITLNEILKQLHDYIKNNYSGEFFYSENTGDCLEKTYPSNDVSNHFEFKGRGIDLLAQIADDFSLMFWFVGRNVIFAEKFSKDYVRTHNSITSRDLSLLVTQTENEFPIMDIRHTSQYNNYYKNKKLYISYVTGELNVLWCGIMTLTEILQDNGYIISCVFSYEKGLYEISLILTEAEYVSEFEVCTNIPEEDSKDMMYYLSQPKQIFLGRKIPSTKGINGLQHISDINVGLQNLEKTKDPVRNFSEKNEEVMVTESSPFAGNHYGLQFPSYKNEKETEVILSPQSANMVSIGKTFNKETAPTRSSAEDFRFTLKDGTTIYYKSSTGELTIAAKNKISIGTGSFNDTSVPSISTEKPAARQDDPTISNSQTDPTFWTWMQKFQSAINGWTPVPADGGAVLKALLSSLIIPMPSSQTGKIQTGSSHVNIGG